MDINSFIKEIKALPDLGQFSWHETIRPVKARYGALERPLPEELNELLLNGGVKGLYSHQSAAIDKIRDGKNVVVMTPTASGKSLIYNLPVLESILADPLSRALYIFPLKGLTQAQHKTLKDVERAMGLVNLAGIYDGDTSSYMRRKIRENNTNIILTNPDMLHAGLLAYHEKWEPFFRNLKYVIIDELHCYRGVFGSHVSGVLRRLRRINAFYGAKPQFIASSATIANPLELAEKLTGLDFEVIEKSGAPVGKKNFLFLDPKESPNKTATRLLTSALKAGLKTIAFTKARKITELIYRRIKDRTPELAERISPYRAGFLPRERREIEARLFNGTLDGVITTSALELGIDIGSLDVCLLVGYPGTISSTWQRAGRVGRTGRDSLVIMIAMQDALDKFFIRNPEYFFNKTCESAVLDIDNFPIKKDHLLCTASEIHLTGADSVFDMPRAIAPLKELEAEQKIRHWEREDIWYPRVKSPHRKINLRGAGQSYKILNEERKLLGLSSSSRVFRELHPGALYLHKGDLYRVLSLHTARREAICRLVHTRYYTTAHTHEDIEIIEAGQSKDFNGLRVSHALVKVTEQVLGYWIKDINTRERVRSYDLDLPIEQFKTSAIWTTLSVEIIDEINVAGFSLAGGLHALEHAQIATLPLFALCERMDLGGVSYTYNPTLQAPAIFIYDGSPGGIGLTLRGYDMFGPWCETTLRLMRQCSCEVSCPSCTQDPHCGNGNEPLDKRAACLILESWLKQHQLY